ncbi:phosphocholine-specific phospholipase C [Amycolatopsis cihanbeyliensis]|uniref:phospholipase C n=1 Tax=Amycolatopsis cihanbeyliensis TaxID=1128664 RepID=A0A542DDS6_AMYCI|nr:phospholipase C, phosphocholine-specific [Amycolatopsis cihanbeyliensis]TQJ01225.1 phospholipase C [Amycolatopsis cihanbeyliensis]
MPTLSRRHLLGLSGAVTGGLAASLLPPSLHTAMARPMRRGGLDAVEHVIVLMQENRSFDHYFGTLRGVRGFADPHPLELPGGDPVFAQPRPGGGSVLPFSLRAQAEREGRDPADIQYLGALPHGWGDATGAWAGGWYDDWIAHKGAATMTYYDRRDIALQYELADTFTVCDAYHCSVFGSTNPNRNFLWSGTVGTEPGTGERAVTNAAYSYDHAGYEWTTYPQRLTDAGVPWRIYQEWDNFTDNAVEYFRPWKDIGRKILAAVDGGYRTTEEFYLGLFGKPEAERERLLARFETGRAALSPAERDLFDRAAFRGAPGSLLPRLRADIAAGTLPRVSWLVPPAADSEHPSASTPVGSANFVYRVLDAIAADPRVWSTTALFLTFDENDGYFDHVPPPVPPAVEGDDADHVDGRPLGLGPRVPMTVVSPWTIGGFVDSRVYDHTSMLRFLERWTGVREPNISPWRRTVAGDLTGAFDFRWAGRPPRPRRPGPVPEAVDRWHPEPPESQRMPSAEPGRRVARPLPYRATVSGSVEHGRLALRLRNDGRAAAHFAVYPYAGELPAPAHHDVQREHTERLDLPADGYRVVVQGPNRSWWELRGSRSGAAAGLDVRTRVLPHRHGVEFVLANGGSEALMLRLSASRHARATRFVRVAPGRSAAVAWPVAHGWYDAEITTESDPTFLRTLTGRVENGRPGISG